MLFYYGILLKGKVKIQILLQHVSGKRTIQHFIYMHVKDRCFNSAKYSGDSVCKKVDYAVIYI